MIWEKDDSFIEIRDEIQSRNGMAALDEIVAGHADIHLNQIHYDHWWLRIDAGGRSFDLDFGIEDGRITVQLTDRNEMAADCGADKVEKTPSA